MARLKREQDRAVRRMKGLIVLSDSDSDSDDSCSSSSDDQDPSPAADTYRRPEGQRPGEEVVIPALLLLNVYIVLVVEVYELVRGRTIIFWMW